MQYKHFVRLLIPNGGANRQGGRVGEGRHLQVVSTLCALNWTTLVLRYSIHYYTVLLCFCCCSLTHSVCLNTPVNHHNLLLLILVHPHVRVARRIQHDDYKLMEWAKPRGKWLAKTAEKHLPFYGYSRIKPTSTPASLYPPSSSLRLSYFAKWIPFHVILKE